MLGTDSVRVSGVRGIGRLVRGFWVKKIGSNRRTTLKFNVGAICKKKEGANRDEQVFRPNR